MSAFISLNTSNNQKIITIDGSGSGAKKTTFYDGEVGVQLRAAQTEESGYNWHSKLPIDEVVIKNVIVYDQYDVDCVAWFVEKNIKIDLTQAYISPKSVDKLVGKFECLKECGISVRKGSAICVQIFGGMREMALSQSAELAAKNIGFTVQGGSLTT